jgi:hypothetical protein
MVKLAKTDENTNNIISTKLLGAIATPIQNAPTPAPSELESDSDSHPDAQQPTRSNQKKATPNQVILKKRAVPKPTAERLTKTVKCLFTPSEELVLRKLVGRLATAAETSLTLSHLMRPYFDLLLHCEEALAEELGRANLSRPLNDKTALAYFEQQLAEVVHRALRKTPVLRADRMDSEE